MPKQITKGIIKVYRPKPKVEIGGIVWETNGVIIVEHTVIRHIFVTVENGKTFLREIADGHRVRDYLPEVQKVLYDTDKGAEFDDTAIGESIFLSREDAEAARERKSRKMAGEG